MHKHFLRFEKIFSLLAIHADLEIKIEIRDKMMMVLFIQKKITRMQLGGNYELKVARYYSLLNSTLCPIDFTLLRNTGKTLYKEFKSQKPL